MDYSNFNSLESFQDNNIANEINSNLTTTANPTLGTNVNNLGMSPTTASVGNALNQPINMGQAQIRNNAILTKGIVDNIVNNEKMFNRKVGIDTTVESNSNQVAANEQENSNQTNPSLKVFYLAVIISLSVTCALAWNEVAKYYIGRSIKFYDGKPTYYIIYASVVTVLTSLVYFYLFPKAK